MEQVRNPRVRRIAPGSISKNYLREVWNYRDLLRFLAWRDFLLRYKQTILGVSWSILKPLFTIAAFTFVFGKLAKLPSGAVPYPVLVFAGLLPWSLFANALSQTSDSIVSNTPLVTKIYFPRVIIPLSSMLLILIDFAISLVLFFIFEISFGVSPGWRLAALPFLILLALFFSFSVILWLSSLNVRFRDVRFIVPYLLQLGLYLSPVGYSSSIVKEPLRHFFSLNPMVGLIDGFRWALFSDQNFYWPSLAFTLLIAILLFFTGLRYFKRVERSFADVL